jgi:hypothetical protein
MDKRYENDFLNYRICITYFYYLRLNGNPSNDNIFYDKKNSGNKSYKYLYSNQNIGEYFMKNITISDDIVPNKLFTESVNRGLRDIESGEFYTTDELKNKIKTARDVRKKI